jgi:hypothetical protein
MAARNELVTVEGKRLGRQESLFDAERLTVARYMTLSGLPENPPLWDQTTLITNLGMMLNDQLGDCTCAEVGHQIQLWTAIALGVVLTLPDAIIEKLYEVVGGYVPGNPSTDQGAVISNVLGYLKSTGIVDQNGKVHKLGAFASVPLDNNSLAQQMMWLCGGLDLAWALPVAAQSMGTTWDVPAGQPLTGDWEPGSWGGHSTLAAAYAASENWKTPSWGGWYIVTPAFRTAYLEEIWAPVSSDWIAANGTDPDGGFNETQLESDLAQIPQSANPPAPTEPGEGFIKRVEHEAEDVIEDIEHLIKDR